MYEIWSKLGPGCSSSGRKVSTFSLPICAAAYEKNRNMVVPTSSAIMATACPRAVLFIWRKKRTDGPLGSNSMGSIMVASSKMSGISSVSPGSRDRLYAVGMDIVYRYVPAGGAGGPQKTGDLFPSKNKVWLAMSDRTQRGIGVHSFSG